MNQDKKKPAHSNKHAIKRINNPSFGTRTLFLCKQQLRMDCLESRLIYLSAICFHPVYSLRVSSTDASVLPVSQRFILVSQESHCEGNGKKKKSLLCDSVNVTVSWQDLPSRWRDINGEVGDAWRMSSQEFRYFLALCAACVWLNVHLHTCFYLILTFWVAS